MTVYFAYHTTTAGHSICGFSARNLKPTIWQKVAPGGRHRAVPWRNVAFRACVRGQRVWLVMSDTPKDPQVRYQSQTLNPKLRQIQGLLAQDGVLPWMYASDCTAAATDGATRKRSLGLHRVSGGFCLAEPVIQGLSSSE